MGYGEHSLKSPLLVITEFWHVLPDRRTDVSFKHKRMGQNCWPNGLPLKTLNVEATSPNKTVRTGSQATARELELKHKNFAFAVNRQCSAGILTFLEKGSWVILSSCVHELDSCREMMLCELPYK